MEHFDPCDIRLSKEALQPWSTSLTSLIEASIVRLGFPLKRVYKGSIVGFYNIGALKSLKIKIGFWGILNYSYYSKEPPK